MTKLPHEQFAAGSPSVARRHISILFCDLVGSTDLARQLDPEDVSELIRGYNRICTGVIERNGGYSARIVGDGIMAFFGWPQGQENHAELSLRAGIELTEAVPALGAELGRTLAVRVAVASGMVVVGVIDNERREPDAYGETPNLAARLHALAEPNTVAVAPGTFRLTSQMFEFRDLGQHSLKGIEGSVHVHQVLRPRTHETRFERLHGQRPLPMVGRQAELAVISQSWRAAESAGARVVLITGEPGLGKSRLLWEIRQQVHGDEATILTYQCSPLHSATPFFPVVQHLRRATGLRGDETPQTMAEQLSIALGEDQADVELAVAALINLLQLKPDKAVAPLADLGPVQLRELLLTTFLAQLRTLTRRGPILALIEDVQWIDPTTEELVLRALREFAGARLCVIATSRNSFAADWRGVTRSTEMTLGRLDEPDSRALVASALGDAATAALVDGIVARGDGVPLFLEEMASAAVERDSSTSGGAEAPWTRDNIPQTLQALFNERLDRLGGAKHLAQLGAVFGRQFDARALRAMTEQPESEIDPGIEKLIESGLVAPDVQAGPGSFIFKHALIQDSTYGGLLNAEKRRLHRKALTYLEGLGSEVAGDSTETLALHAERGDVWDKAVQYLAAACKRALAKSANREAVAMTNRALDALKHFPAEAALVPAIDLRLLAYGALLALGDVDRLVDVLREADEFAALAGDKRRRAATQSGLANAFWMVGHHRDAIECAERAEKIATEIRDVGIGLSAQFNRACALHALGMVREAADIFTAIHHFLSAEELRYKRFGWPGLPSVMVGGFLAWAAIDLGRFEFARSIIAVTLETVRKVPDPISTVYAQLASGLYELAHGNIGDAIAAFEESTAVNERSQMQLPMTVAWLARALVQGGRATEARAVLAEADRHATYTHGGKYNWFHHHLSMAEAELALGHIGAARDAVRRAQTIALASDEVVHLAGSLKVQGDIDLAEDKVDNAREAYTRALDMAEPRGLRPLADACGAGLTKAAERWPYQQGKTP